MVIMMGLVGSCHGFVFLVVYREKLNLLRWKRRRWRKKIRDVEDEWEEDEKFGKKENQIDEERVIFLQLWMLLGTKEIHWKLINFQLLVSLFFVYVSKGGESAGVELATAVEINGWDFIISKLINGLYNFGFILRFK